MNSPEWRALLPIDLDLTNATATAIHQLLSAILTDHCLRTWFHGVAKWHAPACTFSGCEP